MNVNVFITKDYENEPPSGSEETNQIKANFRKAKMNLKSLARKSGHIACFYETSLELDSGL